MTTLSQIHFHGGTMQAVREGDSVLVAIRPVCDAIGIDYSGQLKRLKRQPWATVVIRSTVGADGKTRDMSMIDRRAFTMWLGNVDTFRLKSDAAREALVRYQCEAADALDAYFHEGVAVNAALSEKEIVQQALMLVNRDLAAANTRIAALEPRAEYVDRYVADEDLRIFRNVAKSNGVSEDELRTALLDHKWIYREESSRWSETDGRKVPQYRYSPYASHREFFRPVPNHQAPRFKGEVHHTLKITPVGALAIARALIRWGLAREDIAA